MPVLEYLNYEVLEQQGWDIEDDDLFEKARNENLDEEDFGSFRLSEEENILKASDEAGNRWPFSCYGGACTNCAIVVKEGEVDMGVQQVLSDEEINQRGVRLACIGKPASDTVKVVYNARYIDYLQNRVVG